MARVNETERLRDLDLSFLEKYNLQGPRYTSYPTAPEWNESVGPEEFAAHLDRVRSDWAGRPLSIYLHIPFCKIHCTFCACNVIISPKGREVSDPYLVQMEREIELHALHNDPERPVDQFHWGGGTPTYLDCDQIRQVHTMISSRFNLAPDAEQSIEIHVSWTTDDHIRTLAQLGFNRISMGVQDFNEKTQRAINRFQTYERTREITELCRSLGFLGINYDLVYGLPYQTEETFGDSVDKVLKLRPDRIALYNFAYLPELMAHQRAIDASALPDGETKFRIFLAAHDRFRAAGYRYIGMDHFALPEDELSVALDQGTLHRNFMGFTTRAGTDLISMGVSSISSVTNMFAQNTKKLTRYTEALETKRFPTERGFMLSRDDELRRRVINDLMCRGRIDKTAIGDSFDIDFNDYFSEEIDRLLPMISDELMVDNAAEMEMTFLGRLFARNIAMVFDAYLGKGKAKEGKRPLFSRTL